MFLIIIQKVKINEWQLIPPTGGKKKEKKGLHKGVVER